MFDVDDLIVNDPSPVDWFTHNNTSGPATNSVKTELSTAVVGIQSVCRNFTKALKTFPSVRRLLMCSTFGAMTAYVLGAPSHGASEALSVSSVGHDLTVTVLDAYGQHSTEMTPVEIATTIWTVTCGIIFLATTVPKILGSANKILSSRREEIFLSLAGLSCMGHALLLDFQKSPNDGVNKALLISFLGWLNTAVAYGYCSYKRHKERMQQPHHNEQMQQPYHNLFLLMVIVLSALFLSGQSSTSGISVEMIKTAGPVNITLAIIAATLFTKLREYGLIGNIGVQF